jgi:hypothetical protein
METSTGKGTDTPPGLGGWTVNFVVNGVPGTDERVPTLTGVVALSWRLSEPDVGVVFVGRTRMLPMSTEQPAAAAPPENWTVRRVGLAINEAEMLHVLVNPAVTVSNSNPLGAASLIWSPPLNSPAAVLVNPALPVRVVQALVPPADVVSSEMRRPPENPPVGETAAKTAAGAIARIDATSANETATVTTRPLRLGDCPLTTISSTSLRLPEETT